MSNWTGRLALCVAVLLVCTLALVRRAETCSDPGDPFDDFAVHPDVPLTKYTRGNLGIVQPTFARSYLVVAFRYLSGVPLTKDEQQAAKAVWQARGIDPSHVYDLYFQVDGDAPDSNPYVQNWRSVDDAANDWGNAKAQVLGMGGTSVQPMQSLGNYNEYLNCAADAFDTASAILRKRVKDFGKDHPGVKAWITAQDAVFANCGDKPEEPVLPAAADASLPEIFRFDREYQIAAAYMYSNHRDEAVARFQQIATESSSPWRELAPYLAARTMVRSSTLRDPGRDFDTDEMQEAATYIQKLLAEQPNRRYAGALRSLLDRAEFRLRPEQQTVRLSESLRKPVPDGRFYNWLFDYTWLLDARSDGSGDLGSPANPDQYKQLTADRSKDDLTDWIMTYQFENPLATQHTLEMWRAHPDSQPWLIAALAKTQPNSPQVEEVLSAARKLPQTAPAFVTAFYHRMRIEAGRNNAKTVRESLDAFLAAPPADFSPYAREALLDLRLDAAANLDDAIRFIPRNSCAVTHQVEIPGCGKTLTNHGADLLNALPLDTLNGLLEANVFLGEVNIQVGRNVFMRAVILQRHDVAQSLSRWVFRQSDYQLPVPREQVDKLIADYQAAGTPEEKQFAAIFLLQHLYAFGYEMNTTQPWCASGAAFQENQQYYRWIPERTGKAAIPAFLSPEQRKQLAAEQTILDQADSQANYYVKSVLAFAEKHPDDPRVPEALSRAVKNTRMNCNNARTGALSKKAFDLLHSRYGNTTWAKNTKYWYGADSF